MIMKNIILLFLMLLSLQTFGQDVVYNFNTTTEGFTSSASGVTLSSSNGAIVRDFGGYEAVLTPDLNLSEDDYGFIRVVIKNNSTFNNFKLFNLDKPGTNWGAATSVVVDIPPSTEFVTHDILIPKNSDNSGVIHQLALRALGNPDGNIEIAQIVLIETGNWVTNNNFETSSNWTASGGDVTAGFTTTDPQEGTQSGTLTFTGTGNKFLESATKNFGETVSPTYINTTLWVKSTIPGAKVSLVYSLKDATGGFLGQISTGNYAISAVDTWELATFNKSGLTNTFNQVLLKIKVVGGLNGTVISFDDVQPSVIFATDNSWTGAKDTEWTDIANWTNGVAPTATKDSNVQVSANNPVISGATVAAVKNLDVNASAALTITGGGSLIVSGTSSGNVTYNTTLGTENWYLVSSPVFGETYDNAYVAANSLAITGTNNAIGFYATADNTWSYMQTNDDATFTSGAGYSVRRAIAAGAGDISFTGSINTSDVAASVITGGTNSFNLIGNPFTAYLNSASFLTDNTGSLDTQTIWVWNQASGIYETKVTVDAFVLAPTQGFFVNVNSSATNLNIAESYQANTGSAFQKTTNTEVKLIMNDGTNDRFAKLYYFDNATTGFDNGYDGKLFSGVAQPFAVYTNLVADNEGKKYQVQSLPNSDLESMVIPIGVIANAGKEITFSAAALNLPDGIKVFLEDRLVNTFNELSDNKTFKVNLSEALNNVGRFYLHTSSNALIINDSVILENVSIYKTNASTLKLVGLPNGIANIKLINVLGKQLMNTSFNANGAKEISLPNLAAGIYIVQLETQSGKLNKKIVLE